MTENLSNEEFKERCRFFEENFKQINEKIERAAAASGRKREDITLLAATKTVPVEVINFAVRQGLDHIGENRVQEFLSKYDALEKKDVSVQFIGHLQTNKVRQIVGKVSMIQSVDSLKLAEEISKQSQKLGLVTDVLVEVNIGKEENKSGIFPEKTEDFLQEITKICGIKVKGLMAIPPICEKIEQIRAYFSLMTKLFIDIKAKKLDNASMDYLSMGMSSDYEEAILEGANMVRIGSSLFGARNYQQ